MTDAEVTMVLDLLDAGERGVRVTERRSTRQCLRGTAVIAVVVESGIPATAYRVRLRNISTHGVAFISPTDLTLGTRLRLELPTGPNLSIVKADATVTRCRYVQGTIHEIGAEFSGV